MNNRVQELCRRLKPVLGRKVDGLWVAYLADSDPGGKADIEQTLELLAAKHLGSDYQPDRSPFPPPPKSFAEAGDVQLGKVSYGNRDLLPLVPDLRIYTVGRGIAPFRFNPLIPPQGCEPGTWIKLIVDVIASAYLGGEGVISLLVSGLHHLYSKYGIFDGLPTHWPTIIDLLAWLRTVKLRGRAAMWQASAERILLAMTYGEFGAVVNAQDNSHVANLLDDNVVLEMDGLSSASDRAMFSEALTLYLYRYRLGQGPRDQLTNLIVLEEAHHILSRRAVETKESVLETSIRMIRQYGIGYVFVDQSASLLSKVAFANSYVTLALSQKLRADVQTIAGAMNLTDEQRDALSTLPVGSAVVRLADEHPEAFLVKIPRCQIREGSVSDDAVRRHMAAYSTESEPDTASLPEAKAVPAVPLLDNKDEINQKRTTHPPSPGESGTSIDESMHENAPDPPEERMSREAIRFLSDVASRPLSTTVSRYQRLHLSRRRGNAIRQDLVAAGLVEAVPIATRSGQIVLHQLTDNGRAMCGTLAIAAAPRLRASLEHSYWASKIADGFERQGYEVTFEHHVKGDGTVDVVAQRAGKRVAIEVETGKSDIKENLSKLQGAGFDRVVLVATSASAVTACQRALDSLAENQKSEVEMVTWLDVS